MSGSDMKQQIFYIHGGDAFTNYDDFLQFLRDIPVRDLPGVESKPFWSKTIWEELTAEGYEVFAPSMPNKLNAKYEEWKIWFERHFEYLRDDVILVGWSLGGYFFAKYLAENETPFRIKALFLLAPLFENEAAEGDGDDGGDFAFDTSLAGNLSKQAPKIYLFHSKDDPIVPYRHSEKFAAALPDAEFITFEDKNHFLIEEFPELLVKIKELG
ncbi:MAG: alpha/beta hydrolase [Candidatus Kaiserbacteria bacterium]|nr:alpha/beta hydrolase [Candidatus Kaiserbacteria bacterium]MCB9816558.1 alpha/beta hydrolase [Candidatus Nomurabacteria bacterium]